MLLKIVYVLLPDAINSGVQSLGSSSGREIFALCGMGGVGKTQLAVEFAFGHLECVNAIFWLHVDDTTKLAKDFGDISLALGLEKATGNRTLSKDLVLDWLCRPHHRRSLVKDAAPEPR